MKKELANKKGRKLEIKSETVLRLRHGGAAAEDEGIGPNPVASPTQCTDCFCPSRDTTWAKVAL